MKLPEDIDGIPVEEFQRKSALQLKPQPAPSAPYADRVAWLEACITMERWYLNSPWWSRFLQRLLAGAGKSRGLHALQAELASLQDAEARRVAHASQREAERQAKQRAQLFERRRSRQALESVVDRLASSPTLADALSHESAPELVERPDRQLAVRLNEGEVVVLQRSAALWGIADAGFALDARIEARQHGTYHGHSGSVGYRGRHWSVTSGSQSGRSESSLSGAVSGSLAPREELRELDQGSLIISSQRVVFLGQRRTTEIPLVAMIGIGVDNGRLDLKWKEQQHQEQYAVLDEDLVAPLIATLARVSGSV